MLSPCFEFVFCFSNTKSFLKCTNCSSKTEIDKIIKFLNQNIGKLNSLEQRKQVKQDEWNNMPNLFYGDENSSFLQTISNAIAEIANLLSIDSAFISYHPNLKTFDIGNERKQLGINRLDEEVFLSRAVVFKNCHFHCEIELENQNFSHRIVFKNCIFEEDIYFDHSTFDDSFDLIDCVINKNLSLSYVKFQSYATVKICESHPKSKLLLNSSYFECDLRLDGIFYCSVDLCNTIFNANLYCSQSTAEISFAKKTYFRGVVLISNATCNGTMYLNDCEFDRLSIIDTTSKSISLDHSLIKSSNFMRSSFERISFLNAKFLSSPPMFGCMFEQEINFTNTQFPSNFDSVAKSVDYFNQEKEKYLRDSLFPEYVETYSISDFFAKNRDIFRKIKYLLLKENNNLEATNYHKAELYCKELELDSKFKKTTRDWIDWFQLLFYRHTSDHHTDLLKIISWVILAIGAFGLLLFACRYGMDLERFISSHSKNPFVGYFDSSYITQSKAIGLVYLLGVCSLFDSKIRAIFFSCIALCMCLISYRYIFGIAALFTPGISHNPLENLFAVLYTLAMILLLFSLQKTARKNSIIPS